MIKKTKLKCPICGGADTSKYWVASGYRLSRCSSCSMVWDHAPLDNLELQYGENYFSNDNPKGGYANYVEGMAINRKTFEDRIKKLEKILGRKGSLLDIGCALGDCVQIAEKRGWDAYGLELSEFAVKIAKKKKLKIFQGTLEESKLPKDLRFDVVMMQDVIEHVRDPLAELRRIKKVLKPGGVVFLVTPDIGGLWHTILRSSWYHYKQGEHIMYFSNKSLSKALELLGYSGVECHKTYHVMSLGYIANRLKFYNPRIFDLFGTLVSKTRFKNIPFRVYAGEIEAWGIKE